MVNVLLLHYEQVSWARITHTRNSSEQYTQAHRHVFAYTFVVLSLFLMILQFGPL